MKTRNIKIHGLKVHLLTISLALLASHSQIYAKGSSGGGGGSHSSGGGGGGGSHPSGGGGSSHSSGGGGSSAGHSAPSHSAPAHSAPAHSAPSSGHSSSPNTNHSSQSSQKPTVGSSHSSGTASNHSNTGSVTGHSTAQNHGTTGEHGTEHSGVSHNNTGNLQHGGQAEHTVTHASIPPRGRADVQNHTTGMHDVYVNGSKVHSYKEVTISKHSETYVRRTYYNENHVQYSRDYHVVRYGGGHFNCYEPRPFRHEYYSYLRAGWGFPVHYHWGFYLGIGFPGYYYYYQPYAVYADPFFWLNDYLWMYYLSLNSAYNLNPAPAADPTVINNNYYTTPPAAPVVTESLKSEVVAQLHEDVENQQNGKTLSIQELLDNKNRLFFVAGGHQVSIEASADHCVIDDGDSLKVAPDESPNADAGTAAMLVVSSQLKDCAPNTRIVVPIEDLNNFQNSYLENLENGVQKLNTDHPDQITAPTN